MRFSIVRPALFSLCLLAFSIQLTAQSFLLPKITFTGAPAYSQAELIAFTGLKSGATATSAQVQTAAQRLSDTGLFADVHFASSSNGLVFLLKLMPADNMLPAHFTNFVWWSPQELATELKTRVPLYSGVIPINGNLQDKVTSALKTMLAEKNITATIVAMPAAQQGTTPTSISFSIESPEVRVHALTIAQASPDMQPKLDRIIKQQTGQPFDQDTTRDAISSEISETYHNNGYLDITVLGSDYSAPHVTPTGIDVDVITSIREGEPYHLTSLTWSGSDVMSAADFNKFVKLKPGDIASRSALRQSLAPLATAYSAKGFQDARIQAPATIDRATHQVAYTVQVIPGEQYRLPTIKVLGLSDDQRREFDSAWHMNPGSFYDATYMTSFLRKNRALRTLNGYSATYRAASDPNTHLVDLTMTFVKGGTLTGGN